METIELPVRRRYPIVVGFIGSGLFAAGAVTFGLAGLTTGERAPLALAIFLALLAVLLAVSAGLSLRPSRPWVISDYWLVISVGSVSERLPWSSVTNFRIGPIVRKTA